MESVIEADCEIECAALSRSLIGRHARIHGRGDDQFFQLNVGDNSEIAFAEDGV
jgi:cysteinyl-tRNA synthetase